MITLPHQHHRAVCPNCARATGVTFGSITPSGGTTTVYLGCSDCDFQWTDVAVEDSTLGSRAVAVPGQRASSRHLM